MASVLRARWVRLTADAPFELLFVRLQDPARRRRVRRSRSTGWITCDEPFAREALAAVATVDELRDVASALRTAVTAYAATLDATDVVTAAQLRALVDDLDARISRSAEGLPAFVAEVAREHEASVLRRLADEDAATLERAMPPTTRLRGMRGYHCFSGIRYTFQRELGAFADVLGGRLVGEGLRVPGYHEIYLTIAPTLRDAVVGSLGALSWQRHAFAVFDVEEYERHDRDGRLHILVDAARFALARLVAVDRLDAAAVEKCIGDVVELGAERTFARDIPAERRVPVR